MSIDRSGVTRTVMLTRRSAIKVPKSVRGWLANRSEWKQRNRPDVARPTWSLLFFAQRYPLALFTGWWDPEDCHIPAAVPSGLLVDPEEDWDPHAPCGHSNEEAKGSSWGRYEGKWLLIDYDRAWQEPRGFVGGLYYGRQERLARKWATL